MLRFCHVYLIPYLTYRFNNKLLPSNVFNILLLNIYTNYTFTGILFLMTAKKISGPIVN